MSSKHNYDYTKVMMMKLKLSDPDNKGGSKVYLNFDDVLSVIKQMDAMSLGITKIIYLVGWQYNGHDDKYPAFFEVNEALKGANDATVRESLLRLVSEAKKYNTVVSYHINFSDAYPVSPLWDEYVANDLILRRRLTGALKITGRWNGRKCYQVRFKHELESGMFAKRVERLLELLPIAEAKTVNVDAFFVRCGKDTTIADERIGRRKMVEYLNQRGIDVTSEFIYREHDGGRRPHRGKSEAIGLIAAYWWLAVWKEDLLRYKPEEIAGGRQNRNLVRDKGVEWLFYGNQQAEQDIKDMNSVWQPNFVKDFVTYTLPYYFIAAHERISITGSGNGRVAHHADGVSVAIKGKQIVQNGLLLKDGDDCCLPTHWIEGGYMAYSAKDGISNWYVANGTANIYEVSIEGKRLLDTVDVTNGNIKYNAKANKAYFILIK